MRAAPRDLSESNPPQPSCLLPQYVIPTGALLPKKLSSRPERGARSAPLEVEGSAFVFPVRNQPQIPRLRIPPLACCCARDDRVAAFVLAKIKIFSGHIFQRVVRWMLES